MAIFSAKNWKTFNSSRITFTKSIFVQQEKFPQKVPWTRQHSFEKFVEIFFPKSPESKFQLI